MFFSRNKGKCIFLWGHILLFCTQIPIGRTVQGREMLCVTDDAREGVTERAAPWKGDGGARGVGSSLQHQWALGGREAPSASPSPGPYPRPSASPSPSPYLCPYRDPGAHPGPYPRRPTAPTPRPCPSPRRSCPAHPAPLAGAFSHSPSTTARAPSEGSSEMLAL